MELEDPDWLEEKEQLITHIEQLQKRLENTEKAYMEGTKLNTFLRNIIIEAMQRSE